MDPSGHFLIELGVVSFFLVAIAFVGTVLFSSLIETIIIIRDFWAAAKRNNDEFQESVKNIQSNEVEKISEAIREAALNPGVYVGAYDSGGAGYAFETMWDEFYGPDELFR